MLSASSMDPSGHKEKCTLQTVTVFDVEYIYGFVMPGDL